MRCMEQLSGKQATWTFDEEKVRIEYAKGWLSSPLNKALGRTEVPLAGVAGVDFHRPPGKKKGWELRLRIQGTDPFVEAGAALAGHDPFLLTGDAKSELLAEYHADQIRFLAEQARTAGPPPEGFPADLAAPLPLHIQVHEGTAAFNGERLVFTWSSEAPSEKRSAQRREFPLSDIGTLEWTPSDGWDYGVLRVVPQDGAPANKKKPVPPKRDLSCLRFDEGAEQAQALLMAATVTAHLAGGTAASAAAPRPALAGAAPAALAEGAAPEPDRDPESEAVIARIRKLGALHAEGVLTDEEFRTKKAELLDRL
ncbi:DUF4429 domain-containing protein [Nocardiopsis coralliicola]